MARIPIRDETHWHELRALCVGASEVASLYDCGYKTRFQLWHEKKGDLERDDFSNNERVILGRCLENGIAVAAGEMYGLSLVKARAHYTDDAVAGALGATPDYFLNTEDSDTVVEVKNASWGSWKDDWIIHEDGFVEAPLRFQLQVQSQLACTGAAHGILVALISGDRIVKCEMPRHETAIASIREKVTEFVASIALGNEPPAEMPGDYHAAREVWDGGEGKIDLSGDAQIESWLTSMAELRTSAKLIDNDIKRIQGEVLAYCTSNKLANIRANGGSISCKWRKATEAHDRHFKAQPAHQELRITVR